MDNNQNRTRRVFFWLVITGGVAVALYFIIGHLFPQLVSQFTALLLSLFVFVTGIFLRKKRS